MSKQSLGIPGAGGGGGGGTGTVTSSGMTAGKVPYATAAQNIENSPLIYNSGAANCFKTGIARLSIGSAAAPDPDLLAELDIISTTRGVLLPRLTLAQRNAIVAPPTYLMLWCKNAPEGLQYYNGVAWQLFTTTISGMTINTIPLATSEGNLEDSLMSQSGFNINVNGGLAVNTIVSANKLIGTGSAPTISTVAGQTTAASIVAGSTDMRGQLSITFDLIPGANTVQANVLFNAAYAAAPKLVLVWPATSLTTSNGGTVVYVLPADIATTGFAIRTGSTLGGLALATINFYYLVIQ
jgi:hypothetical protein